MRISSVVTITLLSIVLQRIDYVRRDLLPFMQCCWTRVNKVIKYYKFKKIIGYDITFSEHILEQNTYKNIELLEGNFNHNFLTRMSSIQEYFPVKIHCGAIAVWISMGRWELIYGTCMEGVTGAAPKGT